jgi:N-acetylglucosamine transport system substrate-binding protein
MKRRWWILLAALLCCQGCSLQKAGDRNSVTLEVAVFEGGYGIQWHKSVARDYERLHPGIRINLWGDPRVDEKIKPRILRHNPPDLASCTLPVWKLIVANKLAPLDDTLQSPAYGQNRPWRDTLTPGILADYQYQGHTYSMPSNLSAWVSWYDRKQFRAHGWKPPETWSEFMALCAKIKAAGIAPLAFQGKYAGGYAWPILLSLYQRLVPFDQWYAMQDLKPGAFIEPEFIHAAKLMQEMATKYYQPGAMAMTHTESQLEWVNGRAAMIFCGLWLKNEMKNAIPPGFEMACFAVPPIDGGKGDIHAIYGGGAENFFVFSEAKHPKEAQDFLKFMLSTAGAHSYIEQLDTLSPVKDSVTGVSISPALQSAVNVLNKSDRLYSDRLSTLYLTFGKSVLPDALTDLLTGKGTPEVFGGRLEAAMQKVREDSDIYKPPTRGVPPL